MEIVVLKDGGNWEMCSWTAGKKTWRNVNYRDSRWLNLGTQDPNQAQIPAAMTLCQIAKHQKMADNKPPSNSQALLFWNMMNLVINLSWNSFSVFSVIAS